MFEPVKAQLSMFLRKNYKFILLQGKTGMARMIYSAKIQCIQKTMITLILENTRGSTHYHQCITAISNKHRVMRKNLKIKNYFIK